MGGIIILLTPAPIIDHLCESRPPYMAKESLRRNIIIETYQSTVFQWISTNKRDLCYYYPSYFLLSTESTSSRISKTPSSNLDLKAGSCMLV